VSSNPPFWVHPVRWLVALGCAALPWCVFVPTPTTLEPPEPREARGRDASATAARSPAPRVRPTPELVALDPLGSANLIVDDGFVYWTNWDNHERIGTGPSHVMRARKAGGEVTILAEGRDIIALAADDANLYWTERGGISGPGAAVPMSAARRVSKRGGSVLTLATRRDTAGGIAVGAGQVYWLEYRDPRHGPRVVAIMMIDPSGAGGPRELDASKAVRGAMSLSLDRSRLFVSLDDAPTPEEEAHLPHPPRQSSRESRFASIRSYNFPTDTGGRNQVFYTYSRGRQVEGAPDGPITAVATGGGRVVWVGNDVISAAPAEGGEPVTLAVSPRPPTGIALDDRYVYWAVNLDEQRRGQGALLRVAIGGGAAEVLLDGLDWPYSVAVDRDHVYWAEYPTGKIVRIPKP
jgi:hypothetical protein